MFCPNCRAEYRPGIPDCPHCKVALVNELGASGVFSSPDAMAKYLEDKDVQALMVGNHVSLQESQRFLADKKVASVIAGEAADEVEPGVHARFFLMVAAEDLDRAKSALESRWQAGVAKEGLLLDNGGEGLERCPACGTAVTAEISECPDCGLFLGVAEEPAS